MFNGIKIWISKINYMSILISNMAKHYTQIWDWTKILVKRESDAWEYKTVAAFIFWTLWAVMRAWYNLIIKSATVNWHNVDPKTTALPSKPSEIAAIMSWWPKAKY